jgi:hypothetical protein
MKQHIITAIVVLAVIAIVWRVPAIKNIVLGS